MGRESHGKRARNVEWMGIVAGIENDTAKDCGNARVDSTDCLMSNLDTAMSHLDAVGGSAHEA